MNLKELKALYPDDPEIQALAEKAEEKELADIAKRISTLESKPPPEPGEDGKTPEKGTDYFTPQDVEEIKDGLKEEVRPIKGVDYFDGNDGESIVGPKGDKGDPGNDGIGIQGERGPKGEKGDKGDPGKHASPEAVIEEIKNLEGEAANDFGRKIGAKIDISQVRNANSFMFDGKRVKFEELMHGGGSGSSLELQTNGVNNGSQILLNLVEGTNMTISDDGMGNITFDASGGGTPASPDGSLQFNNSGAFGGSLFTYDISEEPTNAAVYTPNGSSGDSGVGIKFTTGTALDGDANGGDFQVILGAQSGAGNSGNFRVNIGNSDRFVVENSDAFFATTLLITGGSATNPGLGFTDEPTTGIFKEAASKVGIATDTLTLYGISSGNKSVIDTELVSTDRVFTLPDQDGVIYALPDPNADTLAGWDDTDGTPTNITIGTGLSYDHSTHTLNSSGGGTPASPDTSVQFNDGGSFGGSNILYKSASSIDYFTDSAVTDTFQVEGGWSNGDGTSAGMLNLLGGPLVGVISEITIDNGGLGYQVNDVITATGDVSGTGANFTVDSVDGDGAILSITLNSGGANYRNTQHLIYTGGSGSGFSDDGFNLAGSIFGGGVNIAGTDGLNAQGGSVSISSGNDAGIQILTGNALATNNAGGGLTFQLGNGNGAGHGGELDFTGGQGGDTGDGGALAFNSGAGGSTSGSGGSIFLTAGSAQGGDSDGGSMTGTAGTGFGAGLGGDQIFSGGTSGSGASGGVFIAQGGGQAGTDIGGSGQLRGGNGVNDGDGGAVRLIPGTHAGAGADGKIILRDPSSTMSAILDTSLLSSSDKTFKFGNASGTFFTTAVTQDSDGSLFAASDLSGSTITNEGASALAVYNLPAASVGLGYTFIVQDSDGIEIVANGTNVIYLGDAATAAGGNIQTTMVGASITLLAINSSTWVATASTSTWTVN